MFRSWRRGTQESDLILGSFAEVSQELGRCSARALPGFANVAVGAIVACFLAGVIITPIGDRLHLPFAALGFSAVVSMMAGLCLFRTASALVSLVSTGDRAPPSLLLTAVTNGATAFLIILAMAFGLILPRLLFERQRSPGRPRRPIKAGPEARPTERHVAPPATTPERP